MAKRAVIMGKEHMSANSGINKLDIPYRSGDGHNKLGDIAVLYTENRLTLCQAVTKILNNVYAAGHNYSNEELCVEALLHLGHRFHPDDVAMIELGFDGSTLAWFKDGNRPIGWYCLFKDNYEWYKDPQMVKS